MFIADDNFAIYDGYFVYEGKQIPFEHIKDVTLSNYQNSINLIRWNNSSIFRITLNDGTWLTYANDKLYFKGEKHSLYEKGFLMLKQISLQNRVNRLANTIINKGKLLIGKTKSKKEVYIYGDGTVTDGETTLNIKTNAHYQIGDSSSFGASKYVDSSLVSFVSKKRHGIFLR